MQFLINHSNDTSLAWWCYLVECADGTLYCGVTTDIQRRLKQHNGELVGGAKYTATRRPVQLKQAWSHLDRSTASQHEYQIKQLSRQQKLNLINQAQPLNSQTI